MSSLGLQECGGPGGGGGGGVLQGRQLLLPSIIAPVDVSGGRDPATGQPGAPAALTLLQTTGCSQKFQFDPILGQFLDHFWVELTHLTNFRLR